MNNLVRDALIEGKTTENNYEKDGYAIKWTFVNELELIFVVRDQRTVKLCPGAELVQRRLLTREFCNSHTWKTCFLPLKTSLWLYMNPF